MTDLSRRKLILSGLASAAGVTGLGLAARMAQKYGLIPPDHGGKSGRSRSPSPSQKVSMPALSAASATLSTPLRSAAQAEMPMRRPS